jgi:membrane protease YdiL (CAAX protease family)
MRRYGEQASYTTRDLLRFFAATFAFTWSFWVPAAVYDLNLVVLGVGAFGPSLVSIILSARSEGGDALRRYLATALPRLRFLRLYLIALLTPIAIVATGYAAAVLLTDTPARPASTIPWSLLPIYLFVGLFVFGPLQEEFGWRGFALPRLVDRIGVVSATVGLGALWALWHLPLFFHEDTFQGDVPFWAFAASTVSISAIYTAIWRAENGRLTAVLLLHASSNTAVVGLLAEPADRGDTAPFLATAAITVLVSLVVLVALERNEDGEERDLVRTD